MIHGIEIEQSSANVGAQDKWCMIELHVLLNLGWRSRRRSASQ
jgi:hypothetical protein